jgi:FtsZ-binding cell division protein ZapB
MTSGKRIQQEVGTVELLDCTVSKAKSYQNSTQWLIYLGVENNECLTQELENAIETIKELNLTKKVCYERVETVYLPLFR